MKTPYQQDQDTNPIAWLMFTTLLLIGLIAIVRDATEPLPAPKPAVVTRAPSGDQDEPRFVQEATNANLGELDVPGQYAADHQEDGK